MGSRRQSSFGQGYDKDLDELKKRLKQTVEIHELLGKHREGAESKNEGQVLSQTDVSKERVSASEQSLEAVEEYKLMKRTNECLVEMKARQIKEHERKTREHANLFGWQRLAHEKALALQIRQSINLPVLDQLFASKSVAEITETEPVYQEAQSSRMEVDVDNNESFRSIKTKAWKYTDQRYGMVLTGSSKAAPEYIKFKSGLIEPIDEDGESLQPPSCTNASKGITLQEYFKRRNLL